ncbi:hypothetical protein D3C84_1263780 [compost metagenome]
MQQVELKPFAGDNFRFDPARGTGERHHGLGPARENLARDRDARVQMSAGSASGDHDAGGRHASAVISVVIT